MTRKVEISHKTILFTIFVLLALVFLSKIADIILQFFIALLVTAFLNPYVTKLSKYKIPRGVSVLLFYVIILAIFSFSVSAVVPPLVEQSSSFVNNIPGFMQNVGISSIVSDRIVEQLLTQLGSVPGEIAKATALIFSNVLTLVAVFVLSFYLLTEREKLDSQISHMFGESKKDKVTSVVNHLEVKLGGWVRGQITLMLVVGTATYIGLTILGIPFALPLAIISGLFEVIPYVGPFLSAIPGVVYFLVQQLENYLFVPKIMQHSAGVHPIITLLALAIGFRLDGIVGLLISVPIFITVRVLLTELVFKKHLA
ncbi:MAG: hypothetical protein US62_C0007G0005 [Candidatus Woesebacteria bacterium GW2011_GWA1_37_8]|uniref:AI-2E family transporter n=1 Tax=Candidatus Woesebacteria bacterium GW2011_GWA1_37_8 TaxID=1618546 RepID=A0A0G0I4N8_9BACT|nr:MAG: hypothetical protein US62_C0007G0005 [Candidatus Woesebacteria bacterium GW2011_GWA1_37_8]